MRICCDGNVASTYCRALAAVDDLTVTTVAERLEHDVSDEEIVAFAARNDWIVFTSDSDCFGGRGSTSR